MEFPGGCTEKEELRKEELNESLPHAQPFDFDRGAA
jgi:hypothetical protein